MLSVNIFDDPDTMCRGICWVINECGTAIHTSCHGEGSIDDLEVKRLHVPASETWHVR